ncbi:MAG TPA: hypothetical protein VGX00_04945 [Thermoplasmata archaeon]|nr:hypothetical protein [Thermoplasmata archaeon]
MDAEPIEESELPSAPALDPPPLPEVPSRLARRVLLFEFVVLVEYWIAPTLLGVTNYAGVWSDAGILLFAAFVGTLLGLVLWPLRAHLARAMRTRRDRVAFHGVWIAGFVAALFLTDAIQVSAPAPSASAVVVGATTVYSPFGAWPSLTLYAPGAGLFATIDGEILTVLGLIAILGSAGLRLTLARRSAACPPTRPAGWRTQLASVAVWSPFGLITGCSACAPAYLSVIGIFAPAASSGLRVVPLVPWIGLAGLLYLASFGLSLHLLRKATAPGEDAPSDESG